MVNSKVPHRTNPATSQAVTYAAASMQRIALIRKRSLILAASYGVGKSDSRAFTVFSHSETGKFLIRCRAQAPKTRGNGLAHLKTVGEKRELPPPHQTRLADFPHPAFLLTVTERSLQSAPCSEDCKPRLS